MTHKDLFIYITGPYSSGKTQFIASITDPEFPVVGVGRVFETGVNPLRYLFDLGQILINPHLRLRLAGGPGDCRFEPQDGLKPEIEQRKLLGVMVIVDKNQPITFREAKEVIKPLRVNPQLQPFLVGANKSDLPGGVSPEELRAALNLPVNEKIVPCSGQSRVSVKSVLLEFMALAKEHSLADVTPDEYEAILQTIKNIA